MKHLTLLLAALSLAGCVSLESATQINDPAAVLNARAEVSERLKDAPSARWRDEVVFQATEKQGENLISGVSVCGQVNSRNSFGGYPGFTVYYVGKAPGRPNVVYIGDLGAVKCGQFGYRG